MLESALGWIGELVHWLAQFFPHIVHIDSTKGAVKFVRGRPGQAVVPGMHVWWPLTTQLYTYPVLRQAEELRAQTIVTTDDKVVLVAGLIVFEVFDIERILAHTERPGQTIRDIALTAVHDTCCRLSWDELKQGQRRGTLDTKLRNEAKEALEPYGVRVLKVALTDLAPTRVYRLVQTTATGED